MPVKFPPHHEASPEGLLAIGGDLEPTTLLTAYQQGIFPWPISKDSPMTWFSPDPRGVLSVEDFHISKSFKRFLNKVPYKVEMNSHFTEVIKNCATTTRKHEVGTWITEEILTGYEKLFDQGNAYCISILDRGQLVGGLYGVCINGLVTGESMFHTKTNASKLCLYILMSHLKIKGIPFLDTQMVTPIIESFGGKEIPRSEFLVEIERLQKRHLPREELFSSDFPVPNQFY